MIKREQLERVGNLYTQRKYDIHDIEWEARCLASEVFGSFSRYVGHKCKDIRPLPEEMSEYDLKLWRISHPEPVAYQPPGTCDRTGAAVVGHYEQSGRH